MWRIPPTNVPTPVIAPRSGMAAAGQLAGVGEALGERHADRGAERRREAGDEGVVRVLAAIAIAKIGAIVDSDPSISPVRAGWTRCSRNEWSSAYATSATPGASVSMAMSVMA